jgi:hypothetical protein
VAFIVTIVIPFTAIGQNLFHFVQPTFNHLALILGLSGMYFICSEVVKTSYYRMANSVYQ